MLLKSAVHYGSLPDLSGLASRPAHYVWQPSSTGCYNRAGDDFDNDTGFAVAEELANTISVERGSLDAGVVLPPSNPEGEYDKVVAITQRLFPGPIDVQREKDPEVEGQEYLVLNVVADGTLDEIVARDAQWHHELARIALHSPNVYCLNIDVQAHE
jgi:hypothetical protein